MEGQVTRRDDGSFVAVRTGEFKNKESIFYATANHPFGPWEESDEPILIQKDEVLEKDEVIAPQILIDPSSGTEYLFYTGADHMKGWWMMLAKKE